MFDPVEAALVAALFFGAGALKGFFGIGIPPIVLGVLTFFYDPRLVVTIMLIPIMASNARQALRGISPIVILRKHIWFLPVSTAAIFLTAFVSRDFPTELLLTLTGIAMVIFSITSLIDRAPRVPDNQKAPLQLLSGTLSGLLGGVSGIWGPPMMMYLFALRLPNTELIQTIGIFFFFLSTFMTFGVAAAGEMTVPGTILSITLVVPVLFGMKIGELLRGKLNDTDFLRWFLVLFLLLGLNMLRRGISSSL
ncbi:MAG: sulfite exporter TauE/SafE family protein [Albidovulum sp.]